MFRNNGTSLTPSYVNLSNTTGQWDVSGSIMSLVDKNDVATTISSTYAFYGMFSGLGIVDASELELPATELCSNCYNDMFKDCTSLTAAPAELPATTTEEWCYGGMFYNCQALTASPYIKAQTMDGSNSATGMFN